MYEPRRRKITQENARVPYKIKFTLKRKHIFKRWKIKIKLAIQFEIMVEMKSKLIIRKL